MRLVPLDIAGVHRVELTPQRDRRGAFTRTFCAELLAAHGLPSRFAQSGIAHTLRAGTLRGLHWQDAPQPQAKLVQCLHGRIFDAVVDMRADSPTYRRCSTVELVGDGDAALFVPAGCAHGYLTLTDDVRVHYHFSLPYAPETERSVRWNDPALAIPWPIDRPLLSERDATIPDYPW